MRHWVILAIFVCSALGTARAQNRGSVRYAPPEHEAEEFSRVPSRTALRRGQPKEEEQPYELSAGPQRTTGRRVPQRGGPYSRQTPPPPQPALDLPAEISPAPEPPPPPPPHQEGRPPVKRRRRPKKRPRKPQDVAPEEVNKSEDDSFRGPLPHGPPPQASEDVPRAPHRYGPQGGTNRLPAAGHHSEEHPPTPLRGGSGGYVPVLNPMRTPATDDSPESYPRAYPGDHQPAYNAIPENAAAPPTGSEELPEYGHPHHRHLPHPEEGPEVVPANRLPEPTRSAAGAPTRIAPQTTPDDDAGHDRRQNSRYSPPLQRTSSRYSPNDEEDGDPGPRAPQRPPVEPPRTRGATRYQSPRESVRTRDPERRPTATPPPRTQSTSHSRSTLSSARGDQRYVPEGAARRQPPVGPSADAVVPVDEIAGNDRYRSYDQPPVGQYGPETEDFPLRNVLRSRPQYDAPSDESDGYRASRQPVPAREQTRPLQYQPPARPEPPQRPAVVGQDRPPLQRRQPSPQHQAEPPHQSNPRQSPRHQPPAPQYQNPRPAQHQGSQFRCPEPWGFFADPVQCDKYHECRNGTASEQLCSDGLAFNEASAPKFLRCDSLRDVDCSKRPQLQEPQPSANCPRRFGLFAHESDCTKFWNCVDGSATEVQCPPGLTYNDALGTCDWADLVENSCKSEDLLGFKCPEPTARDLEDGVYTSYAHPANCQLHYICIKGGDGLRRPRLLTCNEGLVFDPRAAACTRPDDVPGCEDFYGSPPPRKKPTGRQREPAAPVEEEEEEEQPAPIRAPDHYRRRAPQNRRTRN